MKKIGNFFRAVSFSIITLSMIFAMAVVPFINQDSYRANAAESSKTFMTDYYTLSYENNEVKLLLNSDLRVYQNLSKNDLKELKNAIVSVGYSAIFDDVSTVAPSTRSAKVRKVASTSRMQNGVNVSNINTIIGEQLVDVESIEDAIYGEKYNVLLEFYVDRYATAYAESNPGTTYEEVVAEVSSQIVNSIQPVIDAVYDAEGMLEDAPQVQNDWIDGVVDSVLTNNANGTNIQLTLDDVSSVFEIIDDSQTIVSIINELDVIGEMSSIVKSSSSDEITNFFVTLDMNTIIDVFNCVEINKEDVKEIISTVGPDCFIDIAETIGADKMADLAHALEFTKADLSEIIKDNASSVSLTSILKTLKTIKVDGRVIFADNQFKMDGLKYLIKSLPRPSEVANYSDDQMKLSWNLDFETIFGDVDFKLTIGFKGDCSLIRSAAREIAEIVDFTVEDGVYTINVKAPAKLSKILLRACNTGVIPDNFKQTIFNNLSASVDEIYNKIVDKTFDQYLDYLKEIDYKTILANLYNAENLNNLFGTNKFTDSRLDKFVDEVCYLVSKASNLTYDRIRDFVCRYVDISALDDTKIEALVDKTFALLRKIDALSLDSALLREFIDPESQYTNENIYNYIDKLSNYEHYFDTLMNYFKKAYEVLPNRIKDNDLMDFYKGNGVFNYTGTINLNFESFLNKLSSKYGDKIYDAFSVLFDRLPTSIDVNLTASFVDTYKVTYNIGETIKEGLLPVGANLEFFAQTTEIDGYSVVKWIDSKGNAYDTMPAFDVELFAVTDYDITINHGESTVEKVYDGEAYTLQVSVAPTNNYTYQWYKDGVAIEGAISSTYDVVDVLDSASYYCEVSTLLMSKVSETVEVVILPAEIDLSEFTWSDNEFTYDGNEHEVTLVDVPEFVSIAYEGNKGTNANSYVASATATIEDPNYVLVGNIEDLTWTINPIEIDLSKFTWGDATFTYDGNKHEVLLVDVPESVNVAYTNNSAVNAGKYTASVVVTPINDNYTVVGNIEDLNWTINPIEIDISKITWSTSEFTYDGNEHVVELENVPENVVVAYTNNSAVNAGRYTASVVVTPINDNYTIVGSVKDLNWSISPAEIDLSEFTWGDATFTYDGNEHEVTLVDVPEFVSIAYEGNKGTNANSYVASATATIEDPNYVLVGNIEDLTWTINPAEFDASTLMWEEISQFTYDGNEHSVVLVDNYPDYVKVVGYEGNKGVNANEYTASVTVESVNPNYTIVGEAPTKKWTINPAKYDISDLTWNYTDIPFIYNGETKEVVLKNVPEFIVDIVYENNTGKEVGEYTAKAISATSTDPNYIIVGEAVLVWNIDKAIVDGSNFVWNYQESTSYVYDGKLKVVNLDLVPNFVEIEYIGDYKATNAGKYEVTAQVITSNNYEVLNFTSTTLKWSIEKAVVNVSDLKWNTSEFTYDTKVHSVELIDVPEGVNVAYTNNVAVNAGRYTASVVVTPVNDNYTVEGSIENLTWEIEKAVINLSGATWGTSTFTYDGNTHVVELENVPENVVVTYVGNSGIAAKEYTASAVITPVNDNYTVEGSIENLTWEIEKAVIDLSGVTWGTSTFTYDGNTHVVELENVPENVVVAYVGNSGIAAKEYTASVVVTPVSDNYIVEGNISDLTWEIEKAVINLDDVTWSTSEFTYDGVAHKVELVGLPAGVEVAYTGNVGVNASTYTAIAMISVINENYVLNGSVNDLTWKIKKAVIDLNNVTWGTSEFTYDGTVHKVELVNLPDYVTVSYTGNVATNAGDYTAKATVTIGDNYTVSKNIADLAWSISKQVIDVSNANWSVSEFTYDGNEKGVVVENIPANVTPVYSNVTKATNAGEYKASVSFTAKSNNYEVAGTVNDLTWKIKPAEFDASTLKWDYIHYFTADGKTHTVELVDVPSFLNVTYTNNSSDKVGEYVAKAGVNAKDKNYVVSNSVSDLTWKIVEKVDVIDPTTTKHELVKEVDGVVVVSIDALTGVGENDDINLDTNVVVNDVDLSSILAKDEVGEIVVVYDISIVDNNQNKMNYKDIFTVSMLIPEAYRGNKNLKVVYIDDNNKVTNMHGSVEGDYMVFGTTHFSKYALVEVKDVKETPKSLNWLIWLLVAIIVILIVIILLLIFRRPKEENTEKAIVAPIVEEIDTSNNYIIIKDNMIVEEKLNEMKSNDLIAPTNVKDYAIGIVENGNVSVFKELRPVKNSYGKINKSDSGEIAINLYKEVVRVVARPENPNIEKIIVEHENVNDDVKIELNASADNIAIKKNIVKVELGEVVNSDENVIVHINKKPKNVD